MIFINLYQQVLARVYRKIYWRIKRALYDFISSDHDITS